MFYSQAGQDAFVNESLNSKKNGYFLEKLEYILNN